MTYSPVTAQPVGGAAQPAASADVTTAAGCGVLISPVKTCLNERAGESAMNRADWNHGIAIRGKHQGDNLADWNHVIQIRPPIEAG